jgi:hypothetical protein
MVAWRGDGDDVLDLVIVWKQMLRQSQALASKIDATFCLSEKCALLCF